MKTILIIIAIALLSLTTTTQAVWFSQKANAPQMKIGVKLTDANAANLSENSSLSMTIETNNSTQQTDYQPMSSQSVATYAVSPLLIHPEKNELETTINVHKNTKYIIKINLNKVDKNQNPTQCNLEKETSEVNEDTYVPLTINVETCQFE